MYLLVIGAVCKSKLGEKRMEADGGDPVILFVAFSTYTGIKCAVDNVEISVYKMGGTIILDI